MPEQTTERVEGATLVDQSIAGPLQYRRFPELSQTLRSQIQTIVLHWEKDCRALISSAKAVSPETFLDSVPDILDKIADALAAGEPSEIERLMQRSPEQGIHRFQIHYNVGELAVEDRILRMTIGEHLGHALGRPMTVEENAALHWCIDLMAQQAMVAFVEFQNAKLREATEAELKYLAFLSHDLRGNLGSVTLWLEDLKRTLQDSPTLAAESETVEAIQQSIHATMNGMSRLLHAERLRHQSSEPEVSTFDLNELIGTVAHACAAEAKTKGILLAIDLNQKIVLTSGPELVRLVLQNLIGNAVKYGDRGTVRISADQKDGRWRISISDEGPGISREHLGIIFEAFKRRSMRGRSGTGLGLAIASQAAKLLDAELHVDSEPEKGSTFSLIFPNSASAC